MTRNILEFPLFNPKRKNYIIFRIRLYYTFKEASGKIEMQRGASATKNVAIIDDFSKKKSKRLFVIIWPMNKTRRVSCRRRCVLKV